MQGKHWMKIANCHHKLYSADSLGRPSLLKQQYKQMMLEPLQSHPGVCNFCAISAAFHLFKFRQEGTTGVHDDVIVDSFISNYM